MPKLLIFDAFTLLIREKTRPRVNCAEVCNPQAATVEVGTG